MSYERKRAQELAALLRERASFLSRGLLDKAQEVQEKIAEFDACDFEAAKKELPKRRGRPPKETTSTKPLDVA